MPSARLRRRLTAGSQRGHDKSKTLYCKCDNMPRTTKTTTFSLIPEMAEQVQEVMREEGRRMSELIREALRDYMEEREWLRAIWHERLREREDAGRRTDE